MQARVLERMHTEIEQQVQAVDEGLQLLEDVFLHGFGTQTQDGLAVKWARTCEQRDEGLAVLDKLSMPACHTMHKAREDSDMHNISIQEMVNTLTKLSTERCKRWRPRLEIILDLPFGFPINNIISLEAQKAKAKRGKDWEPSAKQLH